MVSFECSAILHIELHHLTAHLNWRKSRKCEMFYAEGAKILMIAVIFILLKQLLVNSKQHFPRYQPCKKMIAIFFKLVRKLANANAAHVAISTSQQVNNFVKIIFHRL